jgi:DHA1 family tetracycline resistance protein-like MFS transporter
MCAQISYGLATQPWMVYAIMTVGAFAGIATPALQAYITKHVPPNEQGAVQGVYGGLGSLAGIPAPIIATWSFGWAISPQSPAYVPGIAFFIAAAVIAVALVLTVRAFRQDHRPTPAG